MPPERPLSCPDPSQLRLRLHPTASLAGLPQHVDAVIAPVGRAATAVVVVDHIDRLVWLRHRHRRRMGLAVDRAVALALDRTVATLRPEVRRVDRGPSAVVLLRSPDPCLGAVVLRPDRALDVWAGLRGVRSALVAAPSAHGLVVVPLRRPSDAHHARPLALRTAIDHATASAPLLDHLLWWRADHGLVDIPP